MKKPQIKIEKLWNLNTKWVNKVFEGKLTFVTEFCARGSYEPFAIFKATNPNIKKGHKDYVGLFHRNDDVFITGFTPEEIEKERYQTALVCNNCNTLIISAFRHNMCFCNCKSEQKQIAIDGGKDYCKTTFGKESDYKIVKFDFLTNTFEVCQNE